ncbi:MAG: LysM peptidoglycan-binding domain-containing protein [Pseudomonadota bacterium]
MALTWVSVQAQTLQLSPNAPATYVVKEGDTLWDISSVFLEDPWRWPEIWQVNSAISDPDLIYPGDTLSLVYQDGSPRIVLDRGTRPTVRLSPQVREAPLLSPIPAIPRQALSGFLVENRIVDIETYESAPYILASAAGNLIVGAGHEIYAKGDWASGVSSYDVFRLGVAYEDAENDELLGQEAINLGSVEIVADEGADLRKAIISSSKEELKAGDRLLPREVNPINPSFFPTTPVNGIDGEIIGLLSNQSKAAQFESVVMNLGERDGLKLGDVLSIHKAGDLVRDPVTDKRVELPSTEIGILMAYKIFDKVSYGVILSLSEPALAGSEVKAP